MFNYRFKVGLVTALLGLQILFFYQNCGNGSGLQRTSSSSLRGPQGLPDAIPPAPANLNCARTATKGVNILKQQVPSGKIATNVGINFSYDLGDREFIFMSNGSIDSNLQTNFTTNYNAVLVNYSTQIVTPVSLPTLPSPQVLGGNMSANSCSVQAGASDKQNNVIISISCNNSTNYIFSYSKQSNSWANIYSSTTLSVIDVAFDEQARPVILLENYASAQVQYYNGSQWIQIGQTITLTRTPALNTFVTRLFAVKSAHPIALLRSENASHQNTFSLLNLLTGQTLALANQPAIVASPTFNGFFAQASDTGNIFYDVAPWGQASLNQFNLSTSAESNQSSSATNLAFSPGWMYAILNYNVVAKFDWNGSTCALRLSYDSGKSFSSVAINDSYFGNHCEMGSPILNTSNGDMYSVTVDGALLSSGQISMNLSKISCQ